MGKVFDWRAILASILIGSLVLSVLLSVIPIVRWGHGITTKEAIARAHTIVSQTVRENYRILSKNNDFTRLTVEAAESEKGILNCYVIDPRSNGILAPAKVFNKTVNDVYSLLAIKKIIEDKEEIVTVEQPNGIYVIAQPVKVYSAEENDRILQAIVIAQFEIDKEVTSTFTPLVEASLFSVLMSLIAFFLIFKMMTHPILQMQEQLEAALKGENVAISCDTKFPELEALATVMNFSVSRLRDAGNPGAGSNLSPDDPEVVEQEYLKTVAEFEFGTSDGLLVLDRDKRVKYVGRILEDLIGLRSQYAIGQNISDACRDQSFAGTAIDLVERVMSSLGESQSANLDINGIARDMAAAPHRDRSGDIAFVLITVKMGAA